MAEAPSTAHLELIARHGSGPLERALATVLLARRRGREQELRDLIEEVSTEVIADGGTSSKSGDNGPDAPGGGPGSIGGPPRPPNAPHHEREPSLPEVRNVVTAGSLGLEIDIDAVSEDLDVVEFVPGNAEYPPDQLRVRYGSEGPLLTLYRTGSYQITGARSINPEKETLDRFVGQLERLGVGGLEGTFGVENVLARADLGREIDLHTLQETLGFAHAEYDPEVDNSLMYRPDAVATDFRIFSTGKVVLFAVSFEAVDSSFEWLCQTLGNGS